MLKRQIAALGQMFREQTENDLAVALDGQVNPLEQYLLALAEARQPDAASACPTASDSTAIAKKPKSTLISPVAPRQRTGSSLMLTPPIVAFRADL